MSEPTDPKPILSYATRVPRPRPEFARATIEPIENGIRISDPAPGWSLWGRLIVAACACLTGMLAYIVIAQAGKSGSWVLGAIYALIALRFTVGAIRSGRADARAWTIVEATPNCLRVLQLNGRDVEETIIDDVVAIVSTIPRPGASLITVYCDLVVHGARGSGTLFARRRWGEVKWLIDELYAALQLSPSR